jgi:type VI secretion system secreted protein Hcp
MQTHEGADQCRRPSLGAADLIANSALNRSRRRRAPMAKVRTPKVSVQTRFLDRAPTGEHTSRMRRGLIAGIALVAAVSLALGVVATSNSGSAFPRARTRSRPLTLQAALAAFSGATSLFLKLDGIPGDSLSVKHAGEIEINSMQWGVKASSEPTFPDITVTKSLDIASPKLLSAAAAGKVIPTGVITAEKGTGGAATFDFAKLTLTNVLVTGVTQSVQSGGSFAERITLKFSRAKFTVIPQNADGSPGTPITFCWNVAKKTAC